MSSTFDSSNSLKHRRQPAFTIGAAAFIARVGGRSVRRPVRPLARAAMLLRIGETKAGVLEQSHRDLHRALVRLGDEVATRQEVASGP